MKQRFLIFATVFVLLAAAWFCGRRELRQSAMEKQDDQPVFVLDAGHGGEDGGAVSSDGLRESLVNLSVCQRLDALLGLFGCEAVMTRDSEALSYPPEAGTVRQRKQADLERRVALLRALSDPILVSIHQNYYPDPSPHGAQVLYHDDPVSRGFAEFTQVFLSSGLGNTDRTASVISDSIYLIRMAECPAILVECGFLSNPEEAALLRSEEYQTKLAVCLACSCVGYEKELEKGYGKG